MHREAALAAEAFRDEFLKPPGRILEIGSYDESLTLRKIFAEWEYWGVDLRSGPGVDQVGGEIKGQFDAVVSSSAFEHDPAFWRTFQTMIDATKPGGYLYVCAPSKGRYHAYPMDCWRFLDDAWKALAESFHVELIRANIISGPWGDNVGVFRKGRISGN